MKKIDLNELKSIYPDVYEFITSHNMDTLTEQRYELNNEDYVNVESYTTQLFSERKYESHRRFIDIQYIISGEENIIVTHTDNLETNTPYSDENDITFYKNNYTGTDNIINSGEMIILEPNDGHMPCVAVDKPSYVKKAVFKIKIK